jgi:hypothetical protein
LSEQITKWRSRLAQSQTFGKGFAKTNWSAPFRHRLFWGIVGILGYGIIPFLIGVTSKGWVVLGVSAVTRYSRDPVDKAAQGGCA